MAEEKKEEGNWFSSLMSGFGAPASAEDAPAASSNEGGTVDASDSPENRLLKLKAEDVAELPPAEAVAALNAAVVTSADVNVALIEACCKRLRVLCREPDNCKLCDEAGSCSAVVSAMGALPTQPAVQLQALAALVNLCSGESNEHRANAVNAGAMQGIVGAMNALSADAEVQEMACIALQNCCYGEDEHAVVRRRAAASQGALEATMAAIRQHEASSPTLMEVAVATLRLMVHRADDIRERAKELGAAPDWIKPIVQPAEGGSNGGLFSFRKLGFGTSRRKTKG